MITIYLLIIFCMAITSKKQKTNPKWFTIMEILISISILSIWFAGIFVMMQNSIQVTQQIQTKTLAINLTREAVEIVHNIRDTNRTKRVWNPESCRLKTDPLVDSDNDGCQNDSRISSWRYIIQEKNMINQQYFALEKVEIPWLASQEDAITSIPFTQLCQNGTWRSACQETGTSIVITRAVQIIGLYHKDTTTPWWDPISCENGESDIQIPCWWSQPKELRFCAHTYIVADKSTHIQLCSMLTNFKQ